MTKTDRFQASICIPSTALRHCNATNLSQATNIAYQIARAASIYNVMEVIVLDIPHQVPRSKSKEQAPALQGNQKKFFSSKEYEEETEQKSDKSRDAVILATLLQYFVTPPYLVKYVFKPSDRAFLKHAAKLPKITTLPFMTANTIGRFKEGLAIPKHTPKVHKKGKKLSAQKKLKVTKFVNVGSAKPLTLNEQEVPVHVRVTVDTLQKKVVSPHEAYNHGGNSLPGYLVRYAQSISSVYTELCVTDGYTQTAIVDADNYFLKDCGQEIPMYQPKKAESLLLLIGNWQDFERNAVHDPNVSSVVDVIDSRIPVPYATRIEDAALISLTKMFDNTDR